MHFTEEDEIFDDPSQQFNSYLVVKEVEEKGKALFWEGPKTLPKNALIGWYFGEIMSFKKEQDLPSDSMQVHIS